MLPRMQARRASLRAGRAVAIALVLSAGGCHHKKSATKDESAARGVRPEDLKLDLSTAARSKEDAPAAAGTLGITLDQLKKNWNAKAPAHKTSRIVRWLRQPIPGFQAWRASWPLGQGLTLEVVGVGKDMVQTAQVSLQQLLKGTRQRTFNAWETLREAVTPEISQEQLYKGLGLLSKPTKQTRYLDENGYVWQFVYAPLRRVPGGGLVLTVHRAQPKPEADKPFSMLVKFGDAGNYGSMGSFTLEYAPSSRGKGFEEAARLCEQQGLSLCTDAQWQRACSQLSKISAISTWTASFNKQLEKLQTRGGGATCDSGDAVSADDKNAKRGATCCSSNVAMTSTTPAAMKGLFALPALTYEQALDHKNEKMLGAVLAPKLPHFLSLDNATQAAAAKLAMDDAKKNPDRWSALQSCQLKPGAKRLHFVLNCGKASFEGNQGMATLIQYGVFENHIESLKQLKVLRKMGPIEICKRWVSGR